MKLRYLIAAGLAYYIIGYVLYPVYSLINEAGTQGFVLLSTANLIEASINSVVLTLLSVIGSGVVGLTLAYIFHYKNIPLRKILSAVILIPIATPPIAGVVGFLYLIGDNGLLQQLAAMLTGNAGFKITGWSAILLIHIYSFYPFFFLFCSASLSSSDESIREASFAMGASHTRTFFKVVLPMLTPSLMAASLITFMASMASFSAPFIFGGSSRFLTTEIYYAKINGDLSYASLIALLLLAISLVFLLMLTIFRKTNLGTSLKGAVKPSRISEKVNFLPSAAAYLTAALVILPILALIFLSLKPEGTLMRNMYLEPFTIDNYIKMFNEPAFFEPILNSLTMSLTAVILTTVIGFAGAMLIYYKRSRFKFLEPFLTLPYGIPGTVIALAFILAFNTPNLFSGFTALVGTFIILPLAYTVKNVPIMLQSAGAGVQSLDTRLHDASSSMGSSSANTFLKITIPLLLPSIINGALLVFIASAGEFVSTILLYTYSTKTISIEIYNQLRNYNTGIGAAYGVVLFVIVMVVVWLSRRRADYSSY